ncbi:mycofactocin system transcriptional regulator [Nocardioides pocheonensis]|uniref:Mycofactocin system transcriptional regulator n=1 Tax=Nocardioides pocheonensis TaxID=661485 RepID=A0A3N0GIF8_9ACTN|nr:mycofactocin system transcriptional regulator [Nocardioides pocheonensis]RNM12247.1 mycofactocin system transcriptional regulator [Nocardioides pocheonensis]
MTQPSRALAGRPEATSHAEIEQAAFRLFAERGFEGTTMDAIAAEVGVGRRTLFRYYSSKNDIPWGQFDRTLEGFRQILDDMPTDIPLHEAVHRAVVAFNDFPDNASPPHRQRMRLILETPALQAHSVLRYAEWRTVIAEYVARRLGLEPDELVPSVVAQVSLALALTAYEQWLRLPEASLRELLGRAMLSLRVHLGVDIEERPNGASDLPQSAKTSGSIE